MTQRGSGGEVTGKTGTQTPNKETAFKVFFLSLPAEVVTAAIPLLLSSPFCLKPKVIFQFHQIIVG